MTPDTDLGATDLQLGSEPHTCCNGRENGRRVRGVQVNARKKAAFLTAMAGEAWPNLSELCRQLKIGRMTLYDWLAEDPEFARTFDELREKAIDRIEATAVDLATGKYSKLVVSAGQVLGSDQVYSEKMLELLLRSHRPDRYQEERRLLIKHEGQVLQQVLATFEAALDYAQISESQRARIAEYVRSRPLTQEPKLIEAQTT